MALSDATEHYLLPDWNDLPDSLRRKLIDEAEFYCDSWLSGDAALSIYNVLREGLPPQPFPLFTTAGRAALGEKDSE
jgi:hypothetical protein